MLERDEATGVYIINALFSGTATTLFVLVKFTVSPASQWYFYDRKTLFRYRVNKGPVVFAGRVVRKLTLPAYYTNSPSVPPKKKLSPELYPFMYLNFLTILGYVTSFYCKVNIYRHMNTNQKVARTEDNTIPYTSNTTLFSNPNNKFYTALQET